MVIVASRGAVDHDLQRPGDAADSAPAVLRRTRSATTTARDCSAMILQHPATAIFVVLASLAFVYLPRWPTSMPAGVDRPDVVCGDRAVRAGLLRRADLAGSQCPRCTLAHDRPASPSGPTRCCFLRSPVPTMPGSGRSASRLLRCPASAVLRRKRRPAEPRRDVEPGDQYPVLHGRIAVARIHAARAHPGRRSSCRAIP